MSAVRDGLRAFGRFWWEFLVGDTPEIFVATVVIVGVAFGLRTDHVAAIVALPALAVAVLAASAYRGRRRATATRGAGDGGADGGSGGRGRTSVRRPSPARRHPRPG